MCQHKIYWSQKKRKKQSPNIGGVQTPTGMFQLLSFVCFLWLLRVRVLALLFFLCDNIVYSLFIKEQTGGMEMLFLRLVTCITIKRRCVRGLCVCCSFMYLLYRGFCDMTYHQLVCILSDGLLRSGIGNYPVRPSIRIRWRHCTVGPFYNLFGKKSGSQICIQISHRFHDVRNCPVVYNTMLNVWGKCAGTFISHNTYLVI